MFSKSTFLVALFAVAKLAAATPPACLLAAVNTQPDPADLPSICGQHASEVQSEIKSVCGGDTATAMQAFHDVCKNAGVSIPDTTSTTHKPAQPTKSDKPTTTKEPVKPTTKNPTEYTKPTTEHHETTKPTTTGKYSPGEPTEATTKKPVSSGYYGGASSGVAPTPTSYYAPPVGTGGMSTSRYAYPTTGSAPIPTGAAGRVEAGALVALVAAGIVGAL